MRSLIYPPVAPHGIDDLFPGPGAGFYPHRYVLNHETSCRTHVDINCLHILNVPVLFLFVCSGIGGGGGMHVGNITSTFQFVHFMPVHVSTFILLHIFDTTGPNDPRFFPSNPFPSPFGGPGYVLFLFH